MNGPSQFLPATGQPPAGLTLATAARVWLRIALLSFGGPAGQIAMMHRILVQELRWISEPRFLHALNYCHLLPGPEGQQLAIYLGWLLHRTRGGLVAGLLFVLPGAAALLALSILYVTVGTLGLGAGLFFGLKAAVLPVVIQAVLRIGRRALRSPAAIAIAALAFVLLFAFRTPFPAILLGAAAISLAADRLGTPIAPHAPPATDDTDAGHGAQDHARPSLARAAGVLAVWLPLWLGPVAGLNLLFGPHDIYARLAGFFSKVAVAGFGGAYAMLTYVAQRAVEHEHWLSPGDMLAGLGLAETTPGPLVMVLQYVGFLAGYHRPGALPPLLAGTLAGLLVTWVTFAPCFLWVFLGAPYVEALRGVRALTAALSAVTAAVVGVILNLAVWFGLHVLFGSVGSWHGVPVPVPQSLDARAALIAALAAASLFGWRRGVIPTLLGSAAAGMLLTWRG